MYRDLSKSKFFSILVKHAKWLANDKSGEPALFDGYDLTTVLKALPESIRFNLSGAKFKNCLIQDYIFNDTLNLTDCDFSGSYIVNCKFKKFYKVKFTDALLENVDLYGFDSSYIKDIYSSIVNVKLYDAQGNVLLHKLVLDSFENKIDSVIPVSDTEITVSEPAVVSNVNVLEQSVLEGCNLVVSHNVIKVVDSMYSKIFGKVLNENKLFGLFKPFLTDIVLDTLNVPTAYKQSIMSLQVANILAPKTTLKKSSDKLLDSKVKPEN